jgi:long-chain fatty acid transport protein
MVLSLAASKAHASTEINGLFDARSGAMGGTGVAFLDSAGAIPTNPALLDQIGKLTISLDCMYITAQPEAPYTVHRLDAAGQQYANYETQRSASTGAPLPFLGGAYRIMDRLVLGIAAYPIIGQGTTASYRPAPDEYPNLVLNNKAAAGLVEMAEALSFKVTDNLSLGLSWRVTYLTQTVSTGVPNSGSPGILIDRQKNPIYANIDVSGMDFTGLQAGILYKPIPSLRIGFTFRNKVVVDGKGTTTTKNPLSGAPIVLDTIQRFANPHTFRLGFAWTGLQEKLLLAADFKYLMYAEAWKNTETTITMNGMPKTMLTPTNWKDCYNVQLGAEYAIGEIIKVRGGYIMATSATPKDYAQQFMAPPGISHLFGGGVGVKVHDNVNIDAAGAYVVLQSRIDTATPFNGGVGIYASHAVEISLSATYHN